jgi:hypothetical protein
LDGGDFGLVDGDRSPADSNHMNNPRDRKNWEPIKQVKFAEHVSGEKRELDFFKSVRPPASTLVQGQKGFIAPSVQM